MPPLARPPPPPLLQPEADQPAQHHANAHAHAHPTPPAVPPAVPPLAVQPRRMHVTSDGSIALAGGSAAPAVASVSFRSARANPQGVQERSTRRRKRLPHVRHVAPDRTNSPMAYLVPTSAPGSSLAPAALTPAYSVPHWSVSQPPLHLTNLVPPTQPPPSSSYAFPYASVPDPPSNPEAMDNKQFQIHPSFRADAPYRGSILLRAEGVEWYVHEDILRFSSPFFEAILSGTWRETVVRESGSSSSGTDDSSADPENEQEKDQEQQEQQDVRAQEREQSASDSSGTGPDEHDDPGVGDDPTNMVRLASTSSYRASSFDTARSLVPDPEETQWATEPTLAHPDKHQDTSDQTISVPPQPQTISGSTSDPQLAQVTLSRSNRPLPSNQARSLVEELETRERLDALATPAPSIKEDVGPSTSEPALHSHPSSVHPTHTQVRSTTHLTISSHGQPQTPMRRHKPTTTQPRPDPLTRLRVSSYARDGIKAEIDLVDESALTVQEFLLHIYPHTSTNITWLSVGGLLTFSHKVDCPLLFQSATTFLRNSLAGKPIHAMLLAEQHTLAEVYKDASRHVLDHWTDWSVKELGTLSVSTRLKLERKRSWFLERMLKLGLTQPSRDFECHARCTDKDACARTLQLQWETNYRACIAQGPPRPSTVWRLLREGEPAHGSSSFVGLAGPGLGGAGWGAAPGSDAICAWTAKNWIQLLFDRMFSLPSLSLGRGSKVPQQFLSVRLEDTS